MQYVSTRGRAPAVSFTDAILAGLAPDGGLYVPEHWPQLADFCPHKGADGQPTRAYFSLYGVAASAAIEALAGQDTFGDAFAFARDVYADPDAWPRAVTPLTQYDSGAFLLELFHGPSLSFKDVAMQLIGPMYESVLAKRGQNITVVCATSGDTGGAAVEALKNRAGMDLFILLPKGRVSQVQRRFMTASGGANVHALEVDGDFDACQALVKALLNDRAFAQCAALTAVNSINWARILAQSVYYHVAAETLCAHGPVSFTVPTGNFGDAFSGYVAKRMGAPIGMICIAANANDILVRALNTGRFERAPQSRETLSPAMDIQVASNFERILFEALDRDGAHVERLYAQFAQSGGFDIPAAALDFLHAHFCAYAIDDETTRATMRTFAQETHHIVCPHTAVGLAAAGEAFDDDDASGEAPRLDLPLVALATAHPAKFPETVLAATGVHPPLPPHCADLFERVENITPLANDVDAVKRIITERSRAWRG